jgi:hypothetical protein
MVGFVVQDNSNPLLKAMEEEKVVFDSDEEADSNFLSAQQHFDNVELIGNGHDIFGKDDNNIIALDESN